jgi:predicted Zn finger-like uncharacterized protein
MDVTCTRCATVYEIDEGTVSTSGMTVKCTQCGHLFKVRGSRNEHEARRSDPPPDVTAKWRVRRVDGSIHPLESLAELSRAIVEGRFDDLDEISGTGQAWKRLGEIAELSVLFGAERGSTPPQRPVAAVVPQRAASEREARESARESVRESVRESIRESIRESMREPVPQSLPLPPPPSTGLRARKNTPFPEPEFNVMGSPVSSEGTPPPNAPLAPGRPGVSATLPPGRVRKRTPTPRAYPDHAALAPSPGHAAPLALTPAPQVAPLPLQQPAQATMLPLDDFEPPPPKRSFLWIALALPLLLGAAIAGAWLARKPPTTAETHPAREFLSRGDEALAAHRMSRFEEAASQYTKALAYHADDAHILSSLSRVYAVWSQLLRSRIATLEAEGSARNEEIVRLKAEAALLADQAKAHGERAAQRNPGNVEAEVALSDALRLTGNHVAARAELDRARNSETQASAETLRVAAWLAIDEAHGDCKAGRELAQQAVALDAKLIRTRLLLIECLVQVRELDAARLQLDAIRALAPDHPVLLEMSRAFDRASRAPDAGTSVAVAVDKRKPEVVVDAEPDEPDDAPDNDVTEVNPEAAFELVRRGERALEDGSVRAAAELFEQALALSPRSPGALTGLGYVALERGHTQVALKRFSPAARAGHGEALIGLGDTFRRIGRTAQALEAYQSYLKRFPRGSRRSIAQRQIELLREQELASPGGP